MALFCFRHGQLQMREGVKVPNPTSGWTQSTRSRRRRVQTGGSCAMLALGDTGQNLFRTSYSVSMLEVSLKMKNPSMSHNMSLVRFTNSLASSCLASVSHGSLPMTCSICSWIFSCFNRIWPWHVQHADDMPSCFTWEFDHDMSNMPMTCNMPRIWVCGTTCWLYHRLPTMDITC